MKVPDPVTVVMLLLVSSLGFVVVRYSRRYLEGDQGAPRYFRWLFVALGAVTALAVAQSLLRIAVAWLVTSFALHRLLTFYPERAVARVAAHKKFLVSRLADVCLLACLVLVHRDVGSFELVRIESWTRIHPGLSPSMHAAAIFLVLTVVLRSAQLPFHGWLIQVMEAPTPVSALLHAGVVNIGGLVLIRLGPWLMAAVPARVLLLGVALVTTVVAALVMTTRVSVKVALAWSTCAQMGFMLVECALGAFHLALLHLVAHSLYKAHAFLAAGMTVERWQARTQLSTSTSWRSIAVVAAGAPVVGGTLLALTGDVSMAGAAALVVLTIGPMLQRASGVGAALLIAALAAGGHLVSGRLLAEPASAHGDERWAWGVALAGLAALYALKTFLQQRPGASLTRRLYPWLYAGLYLDDLVTRYVFRLWPPPASVTAEHSKAVVATSNAVEA